MRSPPTRAVWNTRPVSDPIRALRVEHLNIVHEDYDATVEHYRRLFGGVVVFDRSAADVARVPVDVGGVLFEIFVPNEFFLHTRYGPHYLGVEYHVADMAAVRETLAARGIRIARDLDVAVHAHPADCHGVSLEFFDDSFHDNEELLDRPMPPAGYWRDEHPLGFTGLRGLHGGGGRPGECPRRLPGRARAEVLYEERRGAVAGDGGGARRGRRGARAGRARRRRAAAASTCGNTAKASGRRCSGCATWTAPARTSASAGSSWCPAPPRTRSRSRPSRTGA